MRWTRQRRARNRDRRAGLPWASTSRADDRRRRVRQNHVVLAPVAGVKLAVAQSTRPGSV